jgi:ribulose-5-phosphate 4-epimerase/fuculose-1-phosphate aldolase
MTIYLEKAPRPTQTLPMSDAEREARVQLAACYRIFDMFGWVEQIFNHITVRVPGEEGHLLINPFGLTYDEVTASNLVKIDLEGRIVDPGPYEINPAGFVIHSAIHAAREDAGCVLHTHSPAATAVACLPEGFVPMTQGGFQFHERIAYHDYEGFALDEAEKKRLVADLGGRNAMLLRNHGVLTIGRSIAEAFRRLYFLEQACAIQLQVMHAGRAPRLPGKGVAERTARNWESGDAGIGTAEPREWQALLRRLDRLDPGFRS